MFRRSERQSRLNYDPRTPLAVHGRAKHVRAFPTASFPSTPRTRVFTRQARRLRHPRDPTGVSSAEAPGLGDVRWGEFFAALTDIGYRGPVCIEVEIAPTTLARGRKDPCAKARAFCVVYALTNARPLRSADLGGTNIHAALADADGASFARRRSRRFARRTERVLERIAELVDRLAVQAGTRPRPRRRVPGWSMWSAA